MIVRISSKGTSFSGLATYLTRDPKAKTDKRVAWTHTLNLAHDHVPSAVDEMLWTARNAELLKQEAGIRAGGRQTENTVKHISLNWSPDETPTKEHMIESAQGFLEHMKWQDHQALLVAHQDKAYSHVHVMLNTVNPENGLSLDDNFERRRAQEWALGYERDNDRIYCEQRLKDASEREDAPTRPVWLAFQKRQNAFDIQEQERGAQDNIVLDRERKPKNTNAEEWKALKEIQREERQEFFSEGKSAFSDLRRSVFREVREEFRERWADYYSVQKMDGENPQLAAMKADLIGEQKTVLDERRDQACKDLRESRDGQYREMLDDQRETRLGLRWRQEAGLDNDLFLDRAADRHDRSGVGERFATVGYEITNVPGGGRWTPDDDAFVVGSRQDNAGIKSGPYIGMALGVGIGFGALSFFDSLADGLIASKPAPKRQFEAAPARPNPFEAAAEEARKRQQNEREAPASDDEYRRRQRSLNGD